MKSKLAWLASSLLGMLVANAEPFPDEAIFFGMCDASAAAAIDREHFIVADDEDNTLRVYSRRGGSAVRQLDLSKFLRIDPREEADIEAGAQLGGRTYWISSHGRNAKGKEKRERHRFFATEAEIDGTGIALQPVGGAYSRLLEDLVADQRLAPYQLAAAAALAPKKEGALNIEGLAATPEGHLLIGFRNPICDGKALIVPLLNPGALIEGERARFGAPLELELDGLGIRSIGFADGRYLIIAGHFGEGGSSKLYEWKGGTDRPERVKGVSFRGMNPEGVAFLGEGTSEYFVLSDDGRREIGGVDCKEVKVPEKKRFRGAVMRF